MTIRPPTDGGLLPRAAAHIAGAIILVWCAATAQAGNGLNLIGFGAESIGMGGADLAVSRDTSALNTNPAGLTRIAGERLDIYNAAAFAREVSHHDGFGYSGNVENSPIVFGNLGYARRIDGLPLVLGVGLFAQGGAGAEYSRMNTPFGTRDDLSSLFSILKIAPGIAWEAGSRLALGASLAITHSGMEQRIFPDTSVFDPVDQARSFFGYRLNGLSGTNYGLKIGAMYTLSERMTLAAVYSNAVDLGMSGGRAVFDLGAIGLGKVAYRNITMKGLRQPQELGLGVAFRPSERLLVALDASWLDWSRAVRSATFRAANPNHPEAPPELAQVNRFEWRDQYVIALGAAWEVDGHLTLRGGYNYGRNPVPRDRTSPLLAPIADRHLTLGAGYRLGRLWHVDGALQYDLRKRVTYTNPQLPFGRDVRQTNDVVSIHLTLARQW